MNQIKKLTEESIKKSLIVTIPRGLLQLEF